MLNQVLVRASTDDRTLALVRAVQQDGTCWCGPTTWQHRPAMRISVSGWATTADDIAASAEAIIAAAQQQAAREPRPVRSQDRYASQLCRKAAFRAARSARNIGCSSIDGEYRLAGTSRPRASAMARTWCGPAPQQMPT